MITNSPLTPRLAGALVHGRVTNIQRLEVKPLERLPNVWVIIDADHHPAFAASHEIGHGQVLIKLEAHPIACCLPVGRGLGNDRALLQRINRGKIDLKVTRTGGTRQGQPVVYLHDLANYLDSIADKAA